MKPAAGQQPYLFIYLVGSGKQEKVYRTAAELARVDERLEKAKADSLRYLEEIIEG